MRQVRFRTLGCYPLTGAISSRAASAADIVAELGDARTSERCGRLIDRGEAFAMETKKQGGYF
jgi:sulfate adenylyltransferase subunit 2